MNSLQDIGQPYTLYHNPFSLCSLMVRFTLALISQFEPLPLKLEEREIDIQHGGQLEEFYLCEVNPKGTVRPSRRIIYLR